MNQAFYIFLCLLIQLFSLIVKMNAQVDTLSKFNYNGFTLDLQVMGHSGFSNLASHEELSSFVSDQSLLDSSQSAGRLGYGPAWRKAGRMKYLPFTFGSKFFYSTNAIHKGSEVFVGIRYGYDEVSHLARMTQELKEQRRFVDPNTNEPKREVVIYNRSYYFNITAHAIYLPMGFNLVTDKSKRFWFSAGLEMCPKFSFAHLYSAAYVLTGETLILNENESINIDFGEIRPLGEVKEIESQVIYEKLKGIDFAAFVVFPFTANFRTSKNWKFFRHVNLSITAAPGYFESYSRFAESRRILVLNLAAGMRYVL